MNPLVVKIGLNERISDLFVERKLFECQYNCGVIITTYNNNNNISTIFLFYLYHSALDVMPEQL